MKSRIIIEKLNTEINLPLKITLTENGTKFFIQNNKKLLKIRMADNVLEYGATFNKFCFINLKKMINLGYISKIEIERTEFLTRRKEIIDITKMLIFEILYIKFNKHIYQYILKTPFIKNWNRLNPSKIIDDRTVFNETLLNESLKNKNEMIEDIKKSLICQIKYEIQKDKSISKNDFEIKVNTCNNFLENLKKSTWYILLQSKKYSDYYLIIDLIKESIIEYLKKTNISEYMALILMEILSNAENIKMEKYIRRFFRKTDIQDLIFNKSIREDLYKKMEEKKDYLYVIWKLGSKNNSIGTENKIQIMILNKDYEYKAIKEEIDIGKNLDNKGKSLYDFYTENNNKSNSNLGLTYLSYIKDASKMLNIRFDSYVSQLLNDELPIVTLSLTFR